MVRAIEPTSGECVAAQGNRCRRRLLVLEGKKERIMRCVLALLAAVNAWGIVPACSEESEPRVSLASLDNIYTLGSTPNNGAEPDRNTALTKECEFESPETIAAIEKNLEDRERIVVMDR
jgi:hypothetical protein